MLLEVNITKKLKEFTLRSQFTLKDGLTGLVGASGSGKSMTMKCIAGLELPDSGRIVLDGKVLFDNGKNINLAPQERKIGYLFQSYALFPNMNVQENIGCGLQAKGLTGAKFAMARTEIIKKFQLQGLEERYPRQLSGGQKQRVALARLLAAEPKVILLDEPFAALDEDLKEEMAENLLALLNEYGGVALMVSHNKHELHKMCSNFYKIKAGSVEKVDEI